MIERNGRRIVLQRQEMPEHPQALPDYSAFIRPVVDANRTEDWSWEWTEEGELRAGEQTGA